MSLSYSRAWVGRCAVALAVIAGAAVLSSATKKTVFTPRDKAYYADANTISFVRPGLVIKIVSAKIAADGTLSVDYKLTDPKGLGLDRLGVTTPGAISVSFLVTYIPKGQTQFVSYVTRQRTSTDGKNHGNPGHGRYRRRPDPGRRRRVRLHLSPPSCPRPTIPPRPIASGSTAAAT